ncbi:hypothetical protein JOS77_22195 [Chromobacterium haemolyticum]|uniref:Uncharacterized protein n=2 Tax=Chromobacteriaceae TaxID=1499392 RepID=A0A1W0D213_9NEIS|nr:MULTISPECIES: hypothetical protein [Chromobacterium]OQS40998.1 hypothetical protein B0T45_09185 [Chromobacterium haemolyticum]QOZ83508.1 hypothetical protein DXT74_10770 [Chromobacterium sp. Rain0013]UGA36886.1 hypothetical protein JOS77_22195 [Chromobacterium haemolyticum]
MLIARNEKVLEGLARERQMIWRQDLESLTVYIENLIRKTSAMGAVVPGLYRALRICSVALKGGGVGGKVYLTRKERLDIYWAVKSESFSI